MRNFWNRLFLEERPSIGLAFFRIFVALTVGFHVLPLFFRLDENYLHTAFKTLNYNFFTPEVITFVQRSPDWLVMVFAGLFCLSWFCFLVGFVILTYVGTCLRGPNWVFYWRVSDWPVH